MARKIVVTSGKGGVGKTTVCALLGKSLALMNKKVIILDLDLSLNNLDVVAGVEDKVVYDMSDVVEGRCRVRQAMINVSRNLYVIQSDRSLGENFSAGNVRRLIDGLDGFDFVLVDCPAGVDEGFTRAVTASDEAIVVVNPNLSSLRDADKVINYLLKFKLKNVVAVVNKVRGDLVVKGKSLGVSDVEEVIGIPVVGAIPDDDAVLIANGLDIEDSRAEKAFYMLAKATLKGSGKVYDCVSAFKGPFGKLKAIMKSRV